MAQNRSIFEDVAGEKVQQDAPKGGMIRDGGVNRRWIRLWLVVLFALVVTMIAVGGITRLTDSGLSITEWAPIKGAIPPLSDSAWIEEFQKYQLIPEFQLQNSLMTLAEFKSIYWWEWSHRQLGRFVGLVWAIGFFGLLFARRMPKGWTGRALLLGGLGGLQGVIGWWMVSSGLSGRVVDVVSYRLAIHLGLAFGILGTIIWFWLLLGRSDAALIQARRGRENRLFGRATGLMYLVFAQILVGALVAGIDAGRNFTDWPLMAGGIFPPGMFDMSPIWVNLFENAGTVQFIHRLFGYLVVIMALVVWRRSRASGNLRTRRAFDWVAILALGQMVLGIGTVLYVVPLGLALVHQLGAVALFSAIIAARCNAGYPPEQSVRG